MADLTDRSHVGEEELLWLFYGEAPNSAEIELHLTLCRNCRAEYERLKIDLNTLDTWAVPERDGEYGQRVWRSLVRRDASIARRGRRFRWIQLLEPRRLAAYALSVAVLVVAFLAGRVTQRPEAPAPSAAVVRERVLAAALTDHLEQSERTLIEITNLSGDSTVDIREEQQRAESLLSGNRLYRQAASSEGHMALAGVLDDLERVLLDVAHASSDLPPAELERLRARVEEQQLLFRLRVLGLRLRDLQEQPIRPQKQKNERIKTS